MRALVCVLILLAAACAPAEITDAQRAAVASEIMDAANDFVAGLTQAGSQSRQAGIRGRRKSPIWWVD